MCTFRALRDYDEIGPDGFNRHAIHHGEREFFSHANALAGLLLLVGRLREFKWLGDKHPEIFLPPAGPAPTPA